MVSTHSVTPLCFIPLSCKKTRSPGCSFPAWQTHPVKGAPGLHPSIRRLVGISFMNSPVFNQEGTTRWQGIMVFFYNRLVFKKLTSAQLLSEGRERIIVQRFLKSYEGSKGSFFRTPPVSNHRSSSPVHLTAEPGAQDA